MHHQLPSDRHVRHIRASARIGLLLISALLSACASMDLHRAAREAGVKGRLKDVTPIIGTFENQSVGRFGPKYIRPWELLRATEGLWSLPIAGGSDYGDILRISTATPTVKSGVLDIALLSHGKVRQTTQLPYALHGNHLFLRHTANFKWLPLGYSRGCFDLAITGSEGGDLVVLYRYEVQGIAMLVANAADSSTIAIRFPHVRKDASSLSQPARHQNANVTALQRSAEPLTASAPLRSEAYW